MDFDAVYGLLKSNNLLPRTLDIDDVFDRDAFSEMLQRKDKSVFVAESDAGIIGTMFLSFENMYRGAQHWCHIDRIAVDENHRRNGMGWTFLEKAADTGVKAGAGFLEGEVNIRNIPAQQMDTGFGFELIRKHPPNHFLYTARLDLGKWLEERRPKANS
ncbi:MAG: GNAT family N-acetyltransferase [Candidatus Marsarchaeota archaeon]|nr:GNAT family N-acetyltransferase [Candidatus Marsarchaeota archaeon]